MMYKVKNSEIEGQHILQDVIPVKLSKFRIILAIIISILTGLIFSLFLQWNQKLYQTFLFLKCNEQECTHYIVNNTQNQSFLCKKLRIGNNNYFIYRFLKYSFKENYCHPLNFVDEISNQAYKLNDKLDFSKIIIQERQIRHQIFGDSKLIIPIKSLFQYLFEELTSPFYILQYFSIVLWIFEGFILFAVVLLLFSFFACIINYILMRRSRIQLQQLAQIKQNVKLIDGTIIDGSQLIVGDKFYVEDDQQLTCDSYLIQGDCMVNEATLTGETIPIPKQSITDLKSDQTHNLLFEGSRVIKIANYTQCIAIVIRTSFSSIRGQYFRNVIFPPPPSRKFYIQACKFQILFGVILIIFYTILVFSIFIDLNYSSTLIVMRYLDYMTWIIPPALPIFFSLAQAIALLQLRQKFIMGSNPLKTEEAGKIDTICFDKTGTLSTLGLQANDYYPHSEQIQEAMACCHHLVQLNNELKGDPLEIEMFKLSGWDIIFDNQKYFSVTNREKFFQIIRINEFSSHLQLMSVIALDKINNNYYLFVKGSPEKIMKISINKINESLQETLQTMTYNGLRVIGLGYKKLNINQLEYDREILEIDINFCGIFSLENRLKGDTSQVIQELLSTNLDIRIISGDNPLTTTHCAFESKIIENKTNSIILDYDQNSDTLLVLDLRQQIPSSSRSQQGDCKLISQYNFIISQLELIFNSECNFTITGNLWGYLMQNKLNEISINQSEDQKLQYNQLRQNDDFDQKFIECINKLLIKTKIFSRMKPHQKKEIVQYLQNNLGKQVMMVGDGSNDCSAIAEALVGVSFNSSDASFTSPFSYQFDSISCVTLILLQGRATKNIIIELFQYLVLISSLKLIGTTILQLQGMNFGDFQYIYMNYMSSVPALILMTLSKSYNILSNSIPNDNMFALSNQLQFYNIFIFISIGCIILAKIVIVNTEFPNIDKPINTYLREGPLNSVMMIANQYFNMIICILVYQSQPFKSKLYYNYPLLFWIIICLIIAFLVNFNQPSRSWLSIIDINNQIFDRIDVVIYFVILGSTLLGYFCQYIIRKKYPQIIQIEK